MYKDSIYFHNTKLTLLVEKLQYYFIIIDISSLFTRHYKTLNLPDVG